MAKQGFTSSISAVSERSLNKKGIVIKSWQTLHYFLVFFVLFLTSDVFDLRGSDGTIGHPNNCYTNYKSKSMNSVIFVDRSFLAMHQTNRI